MAMLDDWPYVLIVAMMEFATPYSFGFTQFSIAFVLGDEKRAKPKPVRQSVPMI
jgi:hypothetical protein